MRSSLRIAWFTPISSSKDVFYKSEYGSKILISKLAAKYEIEIFSARAGQEISDKKSKHYLTASQVHKSNPFDLFFYNLENGKHCDFVRLHLALIPGMTWFHDFTLIDDGPEPILNSPWTKILDIFHQNSKTVDWPSKKDEFLPIRPQAFRESGMSLFSVFSSERDLEQFSRLKYPRLNKEDKGQFLPLPIEVSKFESFSPANSNSDNKLKIACCSKPDVDSHIHIILQSILGNQGVELLWLINADERSKAEELISEFDLSNVRLVENRNIENWDKILLESDLSILLLHTYYSHSNPWLSLSLARGMITTVLDFSEGEYLPNDVVIKIATGKNEVSQLQVIYRELNPEQKLRNINAINFARELFSADILAEELSSLIEQSVPLARILSKKWDDFCQLGRENLISQNIMLDEENHAEATREVFKELEWL